MSREWCFLVTPNGDSTPDERHVIGLAIVMRKPEFDYDQYGHEFRVYVDAPHSPKRVEKTIMHVLAESDVAHGVVLPLPLGRWDETRGRYAFSNAPPDPTEDETEIEAAVSADEIRWAVDARPRSAFDWRDLRTEMRRRGRTVLGETDHFLRVAAGDEADARALIEELEQLDAVGRCKAHPLGRFRRWRIRQQLLGNYGGVRDPTQRF